jgi:CRP/FNR family transcriptional regulator, cyclic AMP receptor protein
MESSVDRLLQVLRRHPFADTFSREEEEKLAAMCEDVQLAEGDYLLREDEPSNRFYLLVSGLVSIELEMEGGQRLRIETQGPGSTVGWSWFLPPNLGSFDIRALEPTRALALDATKLRELMESEPAFGYKVLKELLRVVARRLSQSRLQMVDIHSTARGRFP